MVNRLSTANIRELVDSGDPDAALIVAIAIKNGWIDDGNNDVEKLLRLAAGKSSLGKFALAELLLAEDRDYDEVVALLRDASQANFPYAATSLGLLYRHGLGVAADAVVAASWLQKGGELGDSSGWRWLGLEYVSNHGEIANATMAQKYFEKAVGAGDLQSYSWLAKIYLDKQDEMYNEKALNLLQSGVERDDFGCLMRLARLHRLGAAGLIKNDAMALDLEQRASLKIGKTTQG
jgi:TPR repeat protein